jgi:hypothetical protein
MVDFGHDYTKCDDGDGAVCPMCQFKARLSTLIERAAEGHERYWDDFQGELVDRLHDVIWALHRTRRERFTDEHDDIANGWEAANKLVQMFVALHELRDTVMDDHTLDDDQGDELDEMQGGAL